MLHIKMWSFDWQLRWKLRTIIDRYKILAHYSESLKNNHFKAKSCWERRRKQGDLWHTMNPWFSSILITVLLWVLIPYFWKRIQRNFWRCTEEGLQEWLEMASVHWTVEIEEQMTKGDMKEVFMVVRGSEKVEIHFSLSVPKKELGDIRWN